MKKKNIILRFLKSCSYGGNLKISKIYTCDFFLYTYQVQMLTIIGFFNKNKDCINFFVIQNIILLFVKTWNFSQFRLIFFYYLKWHLKNIMLIFNLLYNEPVVLFTTIYGTTVLTYKIITVIYMIMK